MIDSHANVLRQRASLRSLAALVAAVVAIGAAPAPDLGPELQAMFLRQFKFSAASLADLERGQIVTRSLDTNITGEVAAVGAVRVHGRKEALAEQYRDIVQFKRGPDVLEIGRFSTPPTLDDLAALTISKEDMDLRTCRVTDCDVRLPADAIGRFQRDVDWKAPDADARAWALFKEILFEHVRAYLSGGPGRIAQYDDDSRTVRPMADFSALLRGMPYMGALAPGLPEHLDAVAAHPFAGAEDILYWSKEKFGLTPFITVTHVVITPASAGRLVIASRDVYSSRYIDASLSLTVASDAASDAGAFYLTYVNRSVANALKGRFAAFRRAIVQRRTRASLEENLASVKRRLEQ